MAEATFHASWLPSGNVTSLSDAAHWLARVGDLLDGMGVGVDLDVPLPSLLLMDLAALAEAISRFVVDHQPVVWTSELAENGHPADIADLALRIAIQGARDPDRVAVTHEPAKALAAFLRDLPGALRQG